MLVTTEPLDLFDFDSYAQDNLNKLLSGGEISAENAARYQGRLYARAESSSDGRMEYTFDGVVDGFGFFCLHLEDEYGEYTSVKGCNEIAGTRCNISGDDDGGSLDLAGTIYVKNGSRACFYFNPVYQDPQGRVYAMTGSGFSTDGAGSFSQKLEHSTTSTDADDKTVSYSAAVETTVQFMDAPRSQTAIFMDSGAKELRRQELEITENGDIPEISATGAAFILLETVSRSDDGSDSVSYALYQPEDSSLQVFYARADGICILRDISIQW